MSTSSSYADSGFNESSADIGDIYDEEKSSERIGFETNSYHAHSQSDNGLMENSNSSNGKICDINLNNLSTGCDAINDVPSVVADGSAIQFNLNTEYIIPTSNAKKAEPERLMNPRRIVVETVRRRATMKDVSANPTSQISETIVTSQLYDDETDCDIKMSKAMLEDRTSIRASTDKTVNVAFRSPGGAATKHVKKSSKRGQ